MTSRHPLLLRQLKRLDIDPAAGGVPPDQLAALLAHVSQAYEDAEKDQYLSRRAQELSSCEMSQLYMQLMEAQRIAGLGNWTYDLGSGPDQWSEECARLLRVDPAARPLRLRPLLRRTHKSSRRPLLQAVAGAMRHGREFAIELRLLPHGGQPCWVHAAGQHVAGPPGSGPRLVGTVMGITRRKQTELRQSVEHTVAQLLADAESPLDAIPHILETICGALGWACAAYWEYDKGENEALAASLAEAGQGDDGAPQRDGAAQGDAPGLPAAPAGGARDDPASGAPDALWRRATWPLPPARHARFHLHSGTRLHLDGSEDLIARAARLGVPIWIGDVAADPRFEDRRAAAAAAGVHAAFAFPIFAGERLAGVIELFDDHVQDVDQDLLESARALGRQIGQFLHRKRVEDHVRHLAFHDALTQLPNRALFNRQLGHAVARAARHERRLAVLFIDLDRFKIINDTLGHDAGDRLLQEMSRRLALSLRRTDVVSRLGMRRDPPHDEMLARLGGDEFVVLVEDIADAAAVEQVARKLLDALLEPYSLQRQAVHVTASIGVAVFPEDGRDEHTLMKHADIAMYRAKESGKNGYRFYNEQMNPHSRAQLALESDLRFALRRREFRLHFQAKFDVATGRILGVEALLRWQHPTLGLLMPAQFIPLAEETGLILPLGKWAMDAACAQSRAWQRGGLPPLRMAVNLSALQFGDGDLLGDIAASLLHTGMDPTLLEIEITESAVMRDPGKAIGVLDKLRRMGVAVAIDDFGVGYSSLAQLKHLPVDILKVDRSFIKECADDPADAAITRAAIGIGRSLELQVVAEGVETARHLNFVSDCGCHMIQGFLFGTPLPADEFRLYFEQSLADGGHVALRGPATLPATLPAAIRA